MRRQANLTAFASGKEEVDNEHKQVAVTVAGNRRIGDIDNVLAKKAGRLAEIARTDFLTVLFSSAEADATFVGVNVFPDVDEESVSEAALNYFERV
jgi:hypothetical protein